MRQEKFMLGAVQYHVFCDACDKRMRPGDRAFRCLECWNFDVCASCSTHPHQAVCDIDTTSKTLQNTFSIFQEYPCLGTRSPGPDSVYTWVTYADVMRRSKMVSSWLAHTFNFSSPSCSAQPESVSPLRIVLCSENRVEWLLAYFAAVWRSATVVPIHITTDPGTLEYIMRKVQPPLVVCAASLLPKFLALPTGLIQHVLVMSDQPYATPSPPPASHFAHLRADTAVKPSAGSSSAPLPPYAPPAEAVVHQWREAEEHSFATASFALENPKSIALIRTGQPKGAMISYGAWNADLSTRARIPNILVAYAPLAHSTLANVLHSICGGGRANLFAGDPAQLYDEVRAVRPTQISGPPRFWNVLYDRFKELLDQRTKERPTTAFAMVEAETLKEFSTCLGGRLQHLSIGSAPASPAVLDWMKRCWQLPVTDGYGAIEVGNITSNLVKGNGVEIKLCDWEEYKSTDTPYPRGEICVRSPTMALGYFGDAATTAESFHDGWFHSGDIGQLEGHKYRIIDRKKNFFKLAQGFYISPEKSEAVYIASKFVSQVYVHGDSLRSFPLVVIVPPGGLLDTWALERKITNWKLAKSSLQSEILQDLYSLGSAAELQAYERARGVLVSEEPFTIQNGLLTSTSKLCRHAILKRFAAELEAMYEDLERDTSSTPQELLRRLASQQLGRELTNDDLKRLPSLGLDSLSAARLTALFNKESQVHIAAAELFLPSLPAVLAGQVPAKFDFDAECTLPADIIASSTAGNDALFDSPTKLLLTGCTGFLGVHLLAMLLRNTSTHVTVIVRAASDSAAALRLQEAMMKQLVTDEITKHTARLMILAGDLTLPLFGLRQEVYDSLCGTIDAVLHNAAFVNHLLPYESLKAANVTATIDVLRFCTQRRTKRLHFISTISVGESEEQLLPSPNERDLPEGGYSRSKYVAEQLVTAALKHSLPVIIYRVGLLTWHHVTGAYNAEAYIHRLQSSIVQLNACPDLTAYFNMVPVDFAAEVITAFVSAKGNSWHGKPINIVHPDRSVPLHEISAAIASFGYPITSRPWREFRFLIERTPTCALYPLLPNFNRGLPSSHSRPCGNLNSMLLASNITIPVISHGVIHAFLKRAIAINQIIPPARGAGAVEADAKLAETSKNGEMTQALDIFSALGMAPAAGRAGLRRSDDSALSRASAATLQKKRDGLKGDF